MAPTVFPYKGDFDAHTRDNRALRFIEAYANNIVSDLTLSYPDTLWYSPDCVFFDTTNVTYIGAKDIKTWMIKLFSPFDRVALEALTFLVIDDTSDKGGFDCTVYTEWMVAYYLKNDPNPIFAPRMFVFRIKEGESGFDGLQYVDVKLYCKSCKPCSRISIHVIYLEEETPTYNI